MGLFIVGLVLFTSHGWATVALGASVIVFCLLPILQSRRARVILDVYTHPGSRLIGLAYLAAFTALITAALVLHAVTGADSMVYLAALLAFVLTVIAGPAMETKTCPMDRDLALVGAGFNEVIHVPTRLRICALLAGAGEMEFGVIRDAPALSDSVLSKHLKVLEQAGFADLRKGTVNTRTRTWVHLTKAGSQAFKAHVEELRVLAASADHL